MDYSANLHHQLLQLENQLLVGVGSNHTWTPNTLSSSCDSEPNFHLQDLDSQFPAIDAESFTSLQYYPHGKSQKFAEVLKEEASVSSPKMTVTLNSRSSIEDKDTQRCCCSKIYPTVNVSSRKPLLPESSNSLGFDQSIPSASHPQLQQPWTSCRLVKMPHLGHEITQAKRPCTLKQQKPTQATPKKTRVEPRASCPPLKIRKEKLGDRIAALQQLVAPFGKIPQTDTASVLMEAISYINFLQNQVEMLSHSYMKSNRNKNHKMMCRGQLNDRNEEPERDLKARGLCLVPLACISYLPEDIGGGGGGGGIWPPLANFNWRRV